MGQPYFIAIIIGLLVGIERERASTAQKALGIRTFLLLSLLGAVAGGVGTSLAVAISVFAFALVALSYFHQSSRPDADIGLTTEFAAGLVFCLGYAAHETPILSAILGPFVAVVLFSKRKLHRFTRALQYSELEAGLFLFLAGVVVLNLVPDAAVDPWGIFNPKKFGYLVLLLGGIEFGSYLLAKGFGSDKAPFISGFLGGLVSSTAVLLSCANQAARRPETWRVQVATVLTAQLAAFIELIIIVSVISPDLAFPLAIQLAVGLSLLLCAFLFVSVRDFRTQTDLSIRSPLDWPGVFRLAILLAVILAVVSSAKIFLGDEATAVVSFVAGFFELHGVSVANATMHIQHQLGRHSASLNLTLAVVASLLGKCLTTWTLERGSFSKAITILLLPMIGVIGTVAWLINQF